MKAGWTTRISLIAFLMGCGSSGPPAIQNVVISGDTVQIDFDPTQRDNSQMRRLAQQECKKRDLTLKDVTVAPTSSPTTSKATVYCT